MANKPRHLPKPLRIVRNHSRLFASMLVSALVASVLPADWRLSTRLLYGWDAGALVYLVVALLVIRGFDIKRVQRRAEEQDEGAAILLILVIMAALASLVAVVMELSAARPGDEKLALLLAVITAVLSWTLIHTIFMFHYAHLFYRGPGERGTGLVFPQDDKPTYWDFVYFSFVIGMTFQVSDVQVTSKALRRNVVAHGVLSFVFNVTILALTVNIGANLF